MKTHYDTLEVSKFASDEVIARAYKVLVRKYHPDLQPEDKKAEAEKKLVEINEAYDILSDKTKKAEYDRKLDMESNANNSYQDSRHSNYNSNYSSKNKNYRANNNSNVNENRNRSTNNSMNTTKKNIEEEERLIRQKLFEEAQRAEQEIYNRKVDMMNQMQEDYYNSLRRMGYKIVEPFSWRRFMIQAITARSTTSCIIHYSKSRFYI